MENNPDRDGNTIADPIMKEAGIPARIRLKGRYLEAAETINLAEFHFVQDIQEAKSAIVHEILSMVPAAIGVSWGAAKSALSMSPAPLAHHWGEGVSLGLSAQILKSIVKNHNAMVRSLEHVREVKNYHFENKLTGYEALHLLDLEAYVVTEDDVEEMDREKVRSFKKKQSSKPHAQMPCDKALERADEKRHLTANKKEVKHWATKVVLGTGHIAHDVYSNFRHPGQFLKGMGRGWKTNGSLMDDAYISVDARAGQALWYAQRRLRDQVSDAFANVFSKGMAPAAVQEDFVGPPAPASYDMSEERERGRLKHARARVYNQLVDTSMSFTLENGFLLSETVNGASYLKQGNYAMGIGHLFSGVMGMRPAQLLGNRSYELNKAFNSSRSEAVAKPSVNTPSAPAV